MKKLLLLSMVILAVMTLAAGTALAAKPGGQQEALNDALVLGADLHLSRQGTYGADNTWEWVIGSGSGGVNIQGISAIGLLAAYERTGNVDYLNGAIAAGDTLMDRYDVPDTWDNRPFSQDVEFLVRLAADSGDSSYETGAATYYARLTDNKTAVENVDRYIVLNRSAAGWDLASQIRAALAVGEADYAAGMAARLIERRADWEDVLLGGWDYTTGSYASLLWAFAELGDRSFNGYVGEIRTALLDAQGGDGSWDGGDYQTTAYAILGLSADGTARGAQTRAWAFLRDTQTVEGGWSYSPEYGEVNSEVLMALGSLKLVGVQAGLTDPNPDRGNDTGRHQLDPAP